MCIPQTLQHPGMLQLPHGSRGEGGGGRAAGNVLGAADLPSPSPGAAAAAELPGIGMCGCNHGTQKSWSVKHTGRQLLTQVAASASLELQALCSITREEHSRLFPSVGDANSTLLSSLAGLVRFSWCSWVPGLRGGCSGDSSSSEVVPVPGESHLQCLQFLWKQHVSTAPGVINNPGIASWELSLQGFQAGGSAQVCDLPWSRAGARFGWGWEWELLLEQLPGSAARPMEPCLALIPGVGNCSPGSLSQAAQQGFHGNIGEFGGSQGSPCQPQILPSTIPSWKEKQQNYPSLPISPIA